MKTDVISVSTSGKQVGTALAQADKVASYGGLSPKNALHLRLLTEELLGMMCSITGEKEGRFWIENEGQDYQLHLVMSVRMNPEKREQLLAASTTGKNEAARGLMGRLRDFFERDWDTAAPPLYYAEMPGEFTGTMLDWEWSMTAYQKEVSKWAVNDEKAREMWDELEKSVVTHVADEIKVAIRGEQVEMIIYKKLA